MRGFILACGVTAWLFGSATAFGSQITVTFEEPGIPNPAGSGVVVAQAGGLLFTGLTVRDASNLYPNQGAPPGSGFNINLTVSPPNAATLEPVQQISAMLPGGSDFDFISAWFGATHRHSGEPHFNAMISLRGWREGAIVHSTTFTSSHLIMQRFDAGWFDIDLLTIASNQFNSGYSIMDDLTYAVADVQAIPMVEPLPAVSLLAPMVFLLRMRSRAGHGQRS